MITTALFYLFAGLCLGSGVVVVMARNSVHAVLFLILAFFNAAGLILLLGAEFLAFVIVIVYVGAIAVLFLFVVMMLDINIQEQRRGTLVSYLPVGLLVAGVLLAEVVAVSQSNIFANLVVPSTMSEQTNTESLGRVLYTQYFYAFQLAGAILLTAMIGAIVLTLRPQLSGKQQNIGRQISRTKATGVALVDLQPGQALQAQKPVAEPMTPSPPAKRDNPRQS